MGDENNVVTSKVINQVAVVWMNRIDSLNALNPELFNSLLETLARYDSDPSVRCMLLGSESKAFCVGADIKHMGNLTASEAEVIEYLKMFDEVGKNKKPLVALVNGAAFGGGFELALACDMIIASTRALFAFPEIELGLIPGGGGTQRVTRIVGKQLAMEMILTNRRLSAYEGEKLGFVNKVVEHDALLEEGLKLGQLIASKRPEATRAAKEAIAACDQKELNDGLSFEKKLFAKLLNAPNGKEGISAFLEKRSPNW